MILQSIATPRSLCIAIANFGCIYGYKIMCLKVFESSFSSSVILAVKHLFSDSSFMIAWAESSDDDVSLDFKSSSSPFRSRIESSSARSETSLMSGYFIDSIISMIHWYRKYWNNGCKINEISETKFCIFQFCLSCTKSFLASVQITWVVQIFFF